MGLTGIIIGCLLIHVSHRSVQGEGTEERSSAESATPSATTFATPSAPASAWTWVCQNENCRKVRNDPGNKEPVFSLEACKMFCNDFGLLWPSPTGVVDLGNFLSKLNVEKININIVNHGATDYLMMEAGERFKQLVRLSIPSGAKSRATGKALDVNLLCQKPNIKEFSIYMDESYGLKVYAKSNDKIEATISGVTFFGIRHGLETLSQVIFYDDIAEHLLIVRDVTLSDKPAYPYRGILLDTARSYFPVKSIKATLDAMAAVKLNTFHWHITDSHSFPFVSDRRPTLSQLGAYAPNKVYTKEDIKDIVHYALVRGIRVLPEFDAPAHVGEGWQDTNLLVCFNAEPWSSYCVEPPCGQLNPVKDEVYDYLKDIYTDMAEVFNTTDMFHMGGDEVSEPCWNTSSEIQAYMIQNRWDLSNDSFLKLWDYFQKKAQQKVYSAFKRKLPIIMWTSTLTEFKNIEAHLKSDDYIIQIWTTAADPQVQGLLSKGYRVILSNYDALYFDCGFSSWVTTGNNWCSPYIGWQKVYENAPDKLTGFSSNLILGAEAALWTEQVDESTLDGRLWPRAAAMAERLWSNPSTTWSLAVNRLMSMRDRLQRMGIQSEVVQPEWCYQNEGYCQV